MTAPDVQEEPPRLAEIGRMLADFRAEMRSALGELLRRDVYDAQRGGDLARVDRLEQEQRETKGLLEAMARDRRAMRTQVTIAAIAAILQLLVAIAAAIIIAGLTG